MKMSLVPQGDVELPEVPSEDLPELPEESQENQPGRHPRIRATPGPQQPTSLD